MHYLKYDDTEKGRYGRWNKYTWVYAEWQRLTRPRAGFHFVRGASGFRIDIGWLPLRSAWGIEVHLGRQNFAVMACVMDNNSRLAVAAKIPGCKHSWFKLPGLPRALVAD